MTHDQLVTALAKDQETTKTKIEDILLALNGLFVESIGRGERFSLPFGWLFAAPRKEKGRVRAMIHFKARPEIRAILRDAGLEFPAAEGSKDVCPDCQIRPVQKSKKCSTCLYHTWMARRGHTVKPRGQNSRPKALVSGLKIG
jgi:nucleoid DNA-binding protein